MPDTLGGASLSTGVRLSMRIILSAILAITALGCNPVCAGTTVDLWGSYTNKLSGEKHYDFDLRNFKVGLFLGICPTTKQLQWSYHFDLAGQGPKYGADQLKVDDNVAYNLNLTNVYLKVVSGSVTIDRGFHTLTIDLRVEKDGATNSFVGNGAYAYRD
jgi:hypothetical protein